MNEPQDTRSLARLVRELIDDVLVLVRKEFDLARAEFREAAGDLKGGLIGLVAGAIILLLGGAVLLFAGVYALAQSMPMWMSALIVGGATVLVGTIVVSASARRLKARNLAPRRTVESVRADYRAVKEQVT